MARKAKNSTSETSPVLAVCAFDLHSADGALQIFPAGQFDAPHGAMEGEGPWYIDAAVASKVIDRISSLSNDMLIDYEHQSLKTTQNGKEAPAAGWASRNAFEWREDGLYLTNPKWTAKASLYIESDEYRYLSPVFTYDAQTGEVLDVLSIALTNAPALDDMGRVELKAAANRLLPTHKEKEAQLMNEDLQNAILAALGLAADADLNDKAVAKTAAASLATLAEEHKTLTAAAEEHKEALAAATAEKVDPAKYVPVDVVETLKTQVAALTEKVNESKMDELIEIGLTEGKLLPAQEGWARTLDVAALTAYLENASGVAALTGQQTAGKTFDKDGNEELTEAELAVCAATGVSVDEFKKTKAALAA
ncbi:MAG TPA: hypothetical protein ENJ64_06685 [Thiotrichales bacterium]|nr:hypothetical protein [Thiotrichales bacterium]